MQDGDLRDSADLAGDEFFSESFNVKIALPVLIVLLFLFLVASKLLPKIMHEDQRTVTSFFTEDRDTETEMEFVDEIFNN